MLSSRLDQVLTDADFNAGDVHMVLLTPNTVRPFCFGLSPIQLTSVRA
jgi:hypothetical protein